MVVKLRSWWQKISKPLDAVIIILLVLFLLKTQTVDMVSNVNSGQVH